MGRNPCIVVVNEEAIRWATQAARVLSIASEKAYGELVTVTRVIFYPVVLGFQEISSEVQWAVLNILVQDNAVVHIQETLAST